MGVEHYIINRKTKSVLDIGKFSRFRCVAEKDLAWVEDRAQLRAVWAEVFSDFDWQGGNRDGTLDMHTQQIWAFVEGAAPSDIQFTTDHEIEDWDTFETFKRFELYYMPLGNDD